MKKFFLLQFSIICVSAFSQSAEGGGAYIKNGGKLVNCIIANNYAANGFGVSGTNGEVTNCNIFNNYFLNITQADLGDLVLSDGSFYSPVYDNNNNLIFPAGYSASDVIGVTFWTNTFNNYKPGRFWIVSTDEVNLKWSPSAPYNPIDIPGLYNYNDPTSTLIDYGGEENTELIINAPNHQTYLSTSNCAALYCKKYAKGNASIKWVLPSMGQLRLMEQQLTSINTILSKLGKKKLSGTYWSSNERSVQEAWPYKFGASSLWNNSNKANSQQKVRPVGIIY